MALWAYALRTVAAIKASPWILSGSGIDTAVEDCANQASAMVEKAWGRHIVSRGALTEYHPKLDVLLGSGGIYVPPISGPAVPVSSGSLALPLGAELYLTESPIVSVTTVHEDSARAYGASTLLTVDTDYIVSKPAGKLIRVSGSGGLPTRWLGSWRAVKVVYIAGYQNTAASIVGAEDVPPAVLRVFDDLVAWMIRQRGSKETGLVVSTDALGNRTFTGPAYVTPLMQASLDAAGASPSLRMRTGERDA